MAHIDNIRFERIPGPQRHYIDTWTGREVSRRYALEASAGSTLERLARENREEKPHWTRGDKTLSTLERYVRSHGKAVRGEKADDFRELKERIKTSPKEEWIDALYDYEDPDFWDDDFPYEDFFDSPGPSK